MVSTKWGYRCAPTHFKARSVRAAPRKGSFMFRNSGASLNPIRFLAACMLVGAAANVPAQAPQDSSATAVEFPSAPSRQSHLGGAPFLPNSFGDLSRVGNTDQVPDSGQETPPADDPQLTMFPHKEGGR